MVLEHLNTCVLGSPNMLEYMQKIFEINPDTTFYLADKFSCTVDLEITKYNSLNIPSVSFESLGRPHRFFLPRRIARLRADRGQGRQAGRDRHDRI